MPRLFAVIPACGRSRRMGRPKLLLPLGGRTVLSRLLEALDHPAVTSRVLVVRNDDVDLQSEAARCGVAPLIAPQEPPTMRDTVEIALRHVRAAFAPDPHDGWLLVPADHPLLGREVLDGLCRAWRESAAEILIPACQGRRGHPTFFRWHLADEVFALPADVGLNRLVAARAERVVTWDTPDDSILADLDTPEDLARTELRFAGS